MKLKSKMLMNNTSALLGPLLSIVMTLVIRFLYSSMAMGDGESNQMLMSIVLNLGLSFNIGMGGIMMTTLPLAEDKEKYTLRALLTSSVNGVEFFIGSLIPPFVITALVNFVVLFISGVDVSLFHIPLFAVITIVASLTSCILGLLIGIYAKNQMNASNLVAPFTLVLALLPTFGTFNDTLGKISGFMYTGIVENMVNGFAAGKGLVITTAQWVILFASAALMTLLFILAYKKKGLESD